MKNSKRFIAKLGYVLSCCILFTSLFSVTASASNASMSDDEILTMVGMPQEEIGMLDEDMKAFIVEDLKKSGKLSNMTYFETEEIITPTTRGKEPLDGITFTVSAFKTGDEVYVYPTYEFTTDKQPNGDDSFGFSLGNALESYEYGGQIWYKDYTMSDWKSGGSLIKTDGGLNECEFNGSQLGAPDWPMKMKGCAFAHAKLGSGTDKRISMIYVYNPGSLPFDISLSLKSFGLSFSVPGKIYSAVSTQYLSW